jgi:hypothetical protein
MTIGSETLIRHASYGLELVDRLTEQALVASSRILAERVTPAGEPAPGISFLVNRSRWVFEGLTGETIFVIDADHYLPETVITGVDAPSVPTPDVPGVLHTVRLTPRSGYPFPPTLTRVIGLVTFRGAPVPAAQVDVFPIFSLSPLVEAAVPTSYETADDGQYVAWFTPDPTQDPPTAVAFRANASAVIEGVPRLGSIGPISLQLQTVNTVLPIQLSPV